METQRRALNPGRGVDGVREGFWKKVTDHHILEAW